MNDERRVTGWTGWIMFAGALLVFEGILQFFYGMGAVLHATWFVYAHGTSYLIDASAWGWWMILLGLLIGISGALLWTGNLFGRVMGVIFAVLSILANLALVGVAPVWSILAIVINAVIIYAIAAHGSEMKVLAHER